MKRLIVALLLIIFVIGCSSQGAQNDAQNDAQDGEVVLSLPATHKYILNSEQSQLIWHASRFVGNSHIGTVGISEGQLERKDDKFTSGKFIIDMNTITESKDNQRFLTHIRSDDFFGIEEFPISQLVITQIETNADESADFKIIGDLTIRNQTHEITFPATIVSGDENSLEIHSAFTIDRTKWGIKYGSGSFFKDLGDKTIKDDVRFGLNLVFE